MTKHTQGPWVVDRPEDGTVQRDGYIGLEVWSEGAARDPNDAGVKVATVECFDEGCEPNAALIAAAPELLDAARKARAWLHGYVYMPGHSDAAQCMYSVLNAAIAQAEGESPA